MQKSISCGCVKARGSFSNDCLSSQKSKIMDAVVWVGTYAASLAAGLLGRRQNKNQISNTISNLLSVSLKRTINSDIVNKIQTEINAINKIEVKSIGCDNQDVRVGNQKIANTLKVFSALDANIRREFHDKIMSEFITEIKSRLSQIKDPISELASILNTTNNIICNNIKNEFKSLIENVDNLNYSNIIGIKKINANQIDILCINSRNQIFRNDGQEIINHVQATAYSKLVSETIGKSEIITRIETETRSEIDITSWIVIILIVFLIFLAMIFLL